MSIESKEWLDKNEWGNQPIESDAFSHYTMLDTLLEEYAKHYMSEQLKAISNKTKNNMKKFI
jgi:hypothetical protein